MGNRFLRWDVSVRMRPFRVKPISVQQSDPGGMDYDEGARPGHIVVVVG